MTSPKIIVRSASRIHEAELLCEKLGSESVIDIDHEHNLRDFNGAAVVFDENELYMIMGKTTLHCDLKKMMPRLNEHNLNRELLIRALGNKSGINNNHFCVIDATAGLGEDSLLIAAAGYKVIMYENDPVIAALLRDSLKRADEDESLRKITANMLLHEQNSIEALNSYNNTDIKADYIYLDPMFPERTKSSSVKKKFQMLHFLERPCDNEEHLLNAAIKAAPAKIIIKRPLKAAPLGGLIPTYSIKGNTIRYDCIAVNGK